MWHWGEMSENWLSLNYILYHFDYLLFIVAGFSRRNQGEHQPITGDLTTSQPMAAGFTSDGAAIYPWSSTGFQNDMLQSLTVGPVSERTCPMCKAQFLTPMQMKRHMTSHGQGRYPCPICQKTFNSMPSLSQHKRVVHSTKKHECYVCMRQLSTPQKLRQHLQARHKIFDSWTLFMLNYILRKQIYEFALKHCRLLTLYLYSALDGDEWTALLGTNFSEFLIKNIIDFLVGKYI